MYYICTRMYVCTHREQNIKAIAHFISDRISNNENINKAKLNILFYHINGARPLVKYAQISGIGKIEKSDLSYCCCLF